MIFPDLRALDTHIKAGALLPVYLLYGEENRQIEAARDRLVKTIVPEGDSMNLLRCDGSGGEVDWDGIADLLWSMSFTPGRKCAVVDDLNPSGLGSTGMSKLSELLAQPTEDGVLILTVRGSARQFAKKEAAATKLLNLCDKAGGVCRFAAMTRGDVGKFARQTALRLGCVLEPEEAALLADYCGLDSLRLRQEVEKLAAYRGYTGKILKEDIEAMVTPMVDANVFQLGDRVLRGDFNGAMAIVDDLLFFAGASGKHTDHSYYVLCRLLPRCRSTARRGSGSDRPQGAGLRRQLPLHQSTGAVRQAEPSCFGGCFGNSGRRRCPHEAKRRRRAYRAGSDDPTAH